MAIVANPPVSSPIADAVGKITKPWADCFARWHDNLLDSLPKNTSPVGSIVTTGTSYAIPANQAVTEINRAHAFTVTLPSNPLNFMLYTIADGSGAAATYNITIAPVGYVIGSNYGAWTGYYNGTTWRQVA